MPEAAGPHRRTRRRFAAAMLVVGAIAPLGAVLATATQASAATSGNVAQVAQPPPAVVGETYSYQLYDAIHGVPAYAALSGGSGCTASHHAPAPPIGLSMSSTGLISGVPVLPELAQFCVGLVFPGFFVESAVVTMTVGTGSATLDPTAIPEGTQVAIEVSSLNASTEVGPELESVCSELPGASATSNPLDPILFLPAGACLNLASEPVLNGSL